MREHVVELRKRPQQLATRDRRRHAQVAEGAVAVERIRHLLQQRRPEREVLRIELVDVDRRVLRAAEVQSLRPAAAVADDDDVAAGELALEIDASTAARSRAPLF